MMYDVPPSVPPAGRAWWLIVTSLIAFAGVGLIASPIGLDFSFLWSPNRLYLQQGEDYALFLLCVVVPLLLVPVALLRLKYPLRAGSPKHQQGRRLALSLMFWLGFIDMLGVCALLVIFRNGVPG